MKSPWTVTPVEPPPDCLPWVRVPLVAPPHVAILMPSCGQRGLVALACDAIAAFTRDVSHEVWVLDHGGQPTWSRGSEANGLALDQMIRALGPPVTHVFCMHDDALPLRPGWLSELLAHAGHVVGALTSARNGYAHSAGVLFSLPFAQRHSMLPALPDRDTAEWPADWCALRRTAPDTRWAWWDAFHVEYATFRDDGIPDYVHLGGGTIGAGSMRPDSAAHRDRLAAWIHAMRTRGPFR